MTAQDRQDRYTLLTAQMGTIWDELHRTGDPERRAALAEAAAAASAEMSGPAPGVFGDPSVWLHYAATERAMAGELELPAEVDGSLIGQRPEVLGLWVDLATSDDRAHRADVLVRLAAAVAGAGDGTSCTLTELAETERVLACAAQASAAGAARPAARTAAGVAGPGARAARAAAPDAGLRWWGPMLTGRQIGAVSAVLAGVALLPVVGGWPGDDQAMVAVAAAAVELYTVTPAIRPRRLVSRLTWRNTRS